MDACFTLIYIQWLEKYKACPRRKSMHHKTICICIFRPTGSCNCISILVLLLNRWQRMAFKGDLSAFVKKGSHQDTFFKVCMFLLQIQIWLLANMMYNTLNQLGVCTQIPYAHCLWQRVCNDAFLSWLVISKASRVKAVVTYIQEVVPAQSVTDIEWHSSSIAQNHFSSTFQ